MDKAMDPSGKPRRREFTRTMGIPGTGAEGMILHQRLDRMKQNMGRWQQHILSRHNLQRQIARISKVTASSEGQKSMPTPNGGTTQSLQETANDFYSKLQGTLRHFKSTFSAMAGTMSILESDRAITQAEEVTTLTRLAFFFIPLTYAPGIFGMNVKELADADMSTWIITSACLLLACYSILRPIALIYTLFAGLYYATLPIWIIPLIIYILREGLKTSSVLFYSMEWGYKIFHEV
ncbi:hypothetical protein IWZ03DRAFT_87022 [Phyllosticta citriasiana]|uniref:Uncharacterized protein n=1 Tax=Phyllosticta citriasiana TaxID=595635 RepID=A0ABR1K8B6_9PEZI